MSVPEPQQPESPAIPRAPGESLADALVELMLSRIQRGEWPVGTTIPSERDLIEEYGVSRIALREAILKLRALGVLNVSQGKRSTVAKIDASILGQLFPLMLSIEGRQTFESVFRVRLTIEADTAYLAAQHRSGDDVARMEDLVEEMDRRMDGASARWAEADLALHHAIAQATGNPLYPMLIEALSGFIAHVQETVDEAVRPERKMTQYFHRSIVECIKSRDAEYARIQMQAHLRKSAGHILKSGILERGAVIENQPPFRSVDAPPP